MVCLLGFPPPVILRACRLESSAARFVHSSTISPKTLAPICSDTRRLLNEWLRVSTSELPFCSTCFPLVCLPACLNRHHKAGLQIACPSLSFRSWLAVPSRLPSSLGSRFQNIKPLSVPCWGSPSYFPITSPAQGLALHNETHTVKE